jgi:hypothetical protein
MVLFNLVIDLSRLRFLYIYRREGRSSSQEKSFTSLNLLEFGVTLVLPEPTGKITSNTCETSFIIQQMKMSLFFTYMYLCYF